MKIAIVTIYDFSNYGTVLQNYALTRTLEKLGHDVTTLAISPKKLYKFVMPLANLAPFVPIAKRMKVAKKSTLKAQDYRILDFYSKKKLRKLDAEFDAFILGSDQVWNPKYISSKFISFLKFVAPEKRIAYAPSFGVSSLPDNLKGKFRDGLSGFSHLSVREIEGQKLVEELCGRRAELVLDPTLLLDKSEYEKFSKKAKDKPKNYILTYFFSPKKEHKAKVAEISKKFGLEVINMNSQTCKFGKCSPNEFIDLLMGAKLICTNSFHGHALSIALGKPFVSFSPFSSTNSRIKTLLHLAGLENRRLDAVKEDEFFTLNVDEENMKKMKSQSMKFLTEALREVEKK